MNVRIRLPATAVLAAAGVLIAVATPTAAAAGPKRHPVESFPFTSSVCGFEVTATNPVDREYETDEFGPDGSLVRATVTGALTIEVTRVDTGLTIERNLSGRGVYDYHPDGSFTLTDDGHLLYGLHPGDSPDRPGLYVTSGSTVIDFAANGHRTVLSASGEVEDLCTTLG